MITAVTKMIVDPPVARDATDAQQTGDALPVWATRFPPRPTTAISRDALSRAAAAALTDPVSKSMRQRGLRGLTMMLDWLTERPGDT